MASKKSKAQLEADVKRLRSELHALRRSRIAEGVVNVLVTLIKWGVILGIARYGFLSVSALSGQTTFADIGINFLGKIEVSVALAWSIGGIGIWYGWTQRNLRKDTVEQLQQRIQRYETELDPNRTSSQLTPRGDTRPEDKL